MANKKNVFTPDLTEFHERLADYGHYQFFVRAQLEGIRKRAKKWLPNLKTKDRDNEIITANSMKLINVFEATHIYMYSPFGLRVTYDSDFLAMAEEMERRFNSFMLVSVFEVMATYLKALYAKMLYQLRSELKDKDRRLFHRNYEGWMEERDKETYFHKCVQFAWKNDGKSAMTTFGRFLDLNLMVMPCTIGLDAGDTVKVLGFCRNHIVHGQGRVPPEKLRTLNTDQQAFVTSCMHQSLHTKEQLLLPSETTIDQVFEATGSYGWALYKLLSERCGMIDETGFGRPFGKA